MIVNGTMLRAGAEEVVPASRLVRSDKTNVAMNIVICGLFCDFTQRIIVVRTDVSGQPIGPIFKGQARRKIYRFQTESNTLGQKML
jgi:hypothetical protein